MCTLVSSFLWKEYSGIFSYRAVVSITFGKLQQNIPEKSLLQMEFQLLLCCLTEGVLTAAWHSNLTAVCCPHSWDEQ